MADAQRRLVCRRGVVKLVTILFVVASGGSLVLTLVPLFFEEWRQVVVVSLLLFAAFLKIVAIASTRCRFSSPPDDSFLLVIGAISTTIVSMFAAMAAIYHYKLQNWKTNNSGFLIAMVALGLATFSLVLAITLTFSVLWHKNTNKSDKRTAHVFTVEPMPMGHMCSHGLADCVQCCGRAPVSQVKRQPSILHLEFPEAATSVGAKKEGDK